MSYKKFNTAQVLLFSVLVIGLLSRKCSCYIIYIICSYIVLKNLASWKWNQGIVRHEMVRDKKEEER